MKTVCVFKGKILQEDIIILNIHVPNTRAPKIIEEILVQLKLYIDPYTPVVEGFNTQLSPMTALSDITRETLDLTDLLTKESYRRFHPNTKTQTFFSAFHGTFSIIDHIL